MQCRADGSRGPCGPPARWHHSTDLVWYYRPGPSLASKGLTYLQIGLACSFRLPARLTGWCCRAGVRENGSSMGGKMGTNPDLNLDLKTSGPGGGQLQQTSSPALGLRQQSSGERQEPPQQIVQILSIETYRFWDSCTDRRTDKPGRDPVRASSGGAITRHRNMELGDPDFLKNSSHSFNAY
ncbi:hypothetical protein RRG08_030946 [Elysia crispata]|uniref:Uncharacterized protein n=1 Tax=Elysia crispata TaxID=231223 RepID=A0AAE1DVS0_9GAST|nr:hypothetical protein RRG08_030946 [Elysia crispata]